MLASVDWRLVPIPALRASGTALDYHAIEIDPTGNLFNQKVVNLATFGIASSSAYASAAAPYYRAFETALPSVLARESVAEMLTSVNKLLLPYGVEVFGWDGYRPPELQSQLWDHFIEQGRKVLTDPSDDDLVRFAGLYCSDPRGFDPDDYRTWPVHCTGGSIDLTMRNIADKQLLFMGSIFDDADSISSTRYFENPALMSQSAIEARRNRRLLFHAMSAAGFVNYHHEWWHWDFGTQMWVMNGCQSCKAHYGRVITLDQTASPREEVTQ